MRHTLLTRTATGASCATVAVWLTGCANLKQVSIHDPELAVAAVQAQSAFATAGSGDLWTTMLENLERSATVERELLASTMSMRFEGQLQGVEDLTWDEIVDCAQGGCSEGLTVEAAELTGETVLALDFDSLRTSDKIAATAAAMADIGNEIAALSKQMVDDPSGADETGMLTPAPTSFLADAIGLAEREIATLEERLTAVKEEKIGQLEDAIDGLLPRLPPQLAERREAIRAALARGIGDLRRALQDASFASLSATAAMESEELLTAAGVTPDEGLEPLLEHALRSAFDEFFAPLETHRLATDELLAEAEELIAEALGEGSLPSERLAGIADVLRKAKHLDFLKPDSLAEVLEGATGTPLSGDVAEALGVGTVQELLELIEQRDARIRALADEVSVERLLEELRNEPLSATFASALKLHTERDLGNVGALLDYLKTDESSLQEVRVALMADWRRAVVEGRALELESLRYRLGLTEKLSEALSAQRLAEEALASLLQQTRDCLPSLDFRVAAADTLESLAEGSTLDSAADEVCVASFGDRRKQFESLVGIVGDYFKREGYLHDNERLAHYELVRYEHRRSIDASRMAAAAHEQLVKHGLQGLVAFTQGGITTEQVATVLRFLNVGLLNVIANEE